MRKKIDYRETLKETKKGSDFDKKHPPLIPTKAFIDEGVFDAKDLEVNFDEKTRLWVNKDKTIAFEKFDDAKRYNSTLGTKTTVTPPKPFNNMDRSTYPMNQYKSLSHWDVLVESSIQNPNDPNSKDTKRMLMKEYNNPKTRKNLSDKELKAIGKHKSQMKPIEQKPIPKFDPNYKPFRPEPTQSFEEWLRSKPKKVSYGLNEKLVSDRMAIKRMTDWVLGKKEESKESTKNNNEDEGNND